MPAVVEEGDASPPGGDVVSSAPGPSLAPAMPGEPTPSAALMGDAGGVLAPAAPAAPAASVQQFAFAPPASPADAVPFGAVVGMTPSAPGSEPSAATGPGTTLAPPSPVAAAAPPPVLPPGADHRGGLGGNNAAAGDADLGAVVVPTPRPVILEASELPLGAVVVSIPPPRPEPGADAPGGPSYVVIQAPPTQLAALEPRVTTPALIARLNNDPPNPACIARLRELGVEFEILDPIATDTGCGTSQPLRVRALHNGAVQLNPPATLDCGMAETLVAWVDGEVQPAALAEFEARVTGLQVAASYSCRGVNGARSGPLSEHAYANALDVSAFEIGEETKVAVLASEEPDAPGAMFLSEIRTGACDHFHTVLGPGSDSAHWNHFHLDLAPRGRNGDSRFCQ